MPHRNFDQPKRVHPVSYYVKPRHANRDLRIHQRRDMDAACHLESALYRLGYELGESIIQPFPEDPQIVPRELLQVDMSFVSPGDVLLQMTRPPLDDHNHGDRKVVNRAYTDLEDRLFHLWRRYLCICARSHVVLESFLHDLLPKGYESRREMVFYQGLDGAPYKALNASRGNRRRGTGKKERRTAAFLLRVEEAWEGGPGYIGAFGMDGTVNLVWAYRLSRDLASLLQEPGFVVAELKNNGVPHRCTNLLWAHDWNVNVLFRCDPPLPPPRLQCQNVA